MRCRLLLASSVLVVAGSLGFPGAAADVYPPSGVHVVAGSVSAVTVPTGGAVAFSGSGFAPTSVVRLSVAGVSQGTTTSSTTGTFSARLRLTHGGSQLLAASGLEPGGRLRVASVTVTVLDTVSRPSPERLPTTGSGRVVPGLVLGLVSVGLGSGLVLAARAHRRRARVA